MNPLRTLLAALIFASAIPSSVLSESLSIYVDREDQSVAIDALPAHLGSGREATALHIVADTGPKALLIDFSAKFEPDPLDNVLLSVGDSIYGFAQQGETLYIAYGGSIAAQRPEWTLGPEIETNAAQTIALLARKSESGWTFYSAENELFTAPNSSDLELTLHAPTAGAATLSQAKLVDLQPTLLNPTLASLPIQTDSPAVVRNLIAGPIYRIIKSPVTKNAEIENAPINPAPQVSPTANRQSPPAITRTRSLSVFTPR